MERIQVVNNKNGKKLKSTEISKPQGLSSRWLP